MNISLSQIEKMNIQNLTSMISIQSYTIRSFVQSCRSDPNAPDPYESYIDTTFLELGSLSESMVNHSISHSFSAPGFPEFGPEYYHQFQQ